MQLEGKNVLLKLMQYRDIELMRNWRNDKRINKYFIFRSYITSSQQERWFRKLVAASNAYYFLIYVDNQAIGYTEIKNIDFEKKNAETGILIARPEYRNSLIPIESSILRNDFSFYNLKLHCLTARILESNKRALRLAKAFGYNMVATEHITIDNCPEKVMFLELTLLDYERYVKKIRPLIN